MTGIVGASNLGEDTKCGFGVAAFTFATRRIRAVLSGGAARDFDVEYLCTPPALRCLLVGQLAAGKISFLADIVRQPAVDQNVGFTPQVLIPRSILGLLAENLLQAKVREVIGPGRH